MTDWKYWKSSKFDATCEKCERPIPKDAPRWSRGRGDDGKYHDVCAMCGNPEPGQPDQSSRSEAIAEAHRENMESARQTRNVLATLVAALQDSNKLARERNEILLKEAKR